MSTITVTNTIYDAAHQPIVGAKCDITLVNYSSFDGSNIETVQMGAVTTDATGTWTATLTPNSERSPANSYYVVYQPGGSSHAFVVPASGGPYQLNSILVTQPTSPDASLGIVRYDVAQALTSAQKLQAQTNIGAGAGGGAVSSVFGRTGAVVAQTGDYTAAQVGADASGAAAAAQSAAQTYADRYSGSAAGTASRPLAATDPSVTNSRTPTGTAGGDLTGTYPNPTLGAVGTAGTVGDASHSLTVTTDSKGRVTSATTNAIQIAESQVTNLVTDLTARALVMVPTATKTTAYTAAVNDLVLCDATTASFAVTLPTAPADKSILEVKKLDASANTVTITCGGSDTFAIGGTTLALALQGHAARLQYQTSTGKWIALDNDLPLAATDARYVGNSVVTTKGDLIVGTGAGTVARLAAGANGTIPIADSSQAGGWRAGAFEAIITQAPQSGDYIVPQFYANSGNSVTAALNEVRYALIYLPRGTYNGLAIRTGSSAGTTGAVLRIGLFLPDATRGLPGTLLVDGGTVPATSTFSYQTVTLGSSISWAGGLVWGATVAQVAASSYVGFNGDPILGGRPVNSDSTIYGNNSNYYRTTGLSGAFASNPTMTYAGNASNLTPQLGVKAA